MNPAPNVEELYTVGQGGRRRMVHPADVRGKYTDRRRLIAAVLVVILLVLPFIQVGGRPSVWIDIAQRRFHLFGVSLGPTDSYWLFFLITGVGFSLIVASAMWGRVWCGYACPQTVFLEVFFRRIERWIEGSREQRMRLVLAPWTWPKIWRRALKLAIFFLLAALIAHSLLSYFVSPAILWASMREGPAASPFMFGVATFVTGALFFNFAWFREQFCIIMCPYGRLQSVLSDPDTIIIGYDSKRGEPRGKATDTNAGACVSCNRCVAVCPTGIDIRHGLQLECVGCANCVDACDEVMVKIGRPTGLIRYDSQRALAGEKRRFLRPRVYLYAGFAAVGLVAMVATASTRQSLPVTLVRQTGAPFTVDGTVVRNAFMLHLHNRTGDAVDWPVVVELAAPMRAIVPQSVVHLEPYQQQALPIFIESPLADKPGTFVVRVAGEIALTAPFLVPR